MAAVAGYCSLKVLLFVSRKVQKKRKHCVEKCRKIRAGKEGSQEPGQPHLDQKICIPVGNMKI